MAMAKDRDTLNAEIAGNYKAFQNQLSRLLDEHEGKVCLMRHGQITGMFDTASEAYASGVERFPDGLFSIQEVMKTPIDLGSFSNAVPGC